jgi:hypothetical protein
MQTSATSSASSSSSSSPTNSDRQGFTPLRESELLQRYQTREMEVKGSTPSLALSLSLSLLMCLITC